jgi:hypothetical protein
MVIVPVLFKPTSFRNWLCLLHPELQISSARRPSGVTDIAVELAAILLRTSEVLGSNRDQEIFPEVFLITFWQMLGWNLKLGHGRFHSHPF